MIRTFLALFSTIAMVKELRYYVEFDLIFVYFDLMF